MSKFILLIFLTTKIEKKIPSDVGSDPLSRPMPEINSNFAKIRSLHSHHALNRFQLWQD